MTREEAINTVCNIYQTDKEKEALEILIPELTENEDERIRKDIIAHFEAIKSQVLFDNQEETDEIVNSCNEKIAYLKRQKWISYIEKQKEQKTIKMEVYEIGKGTTICGQDYKCKKDYKEGNCWYIKDVIYHCSRDGYLTDQNGISWSCTPEWFNEYIYTNSEWADKEKNYFVGGQFLQCKLSFDRFKEGEHYWFEYVGDDTYVGRSDNILNQKFHITPRQLFTLFSQQLEEVQGPPQEKQVSLNYEPPFDENPSDKEIIEALIKHLKEQDGFLTAIDCVSTKAILTWLEKLKTKERLDRMAPIYNNKESFESALEKAWKYYNESASRTVDSFEDDYIECVFSKGFREGFLYKEKQKEQKPKEPGYKHEDYFCERCQANAFNAGRESVQKEQKYYWKPTETDVALFNKAVTTNKTLTPTERAQLDIICSKFGYCCATNCSGIIQEEQKPTELTPLATLLSNYLKNDFEYFVIKKWDEKKWNEVMNIQAAELLKSAKNELEKEQKSDGLGKVTINGEPIHTENKSVDIPLAEWSDEDRDNLERVDNYLWILDNYIGDDCATPQGKADKIRGNIQEILSPWLKSLPKRFNLQPKQEWSEGDRNMLNSVLLYFNTPFHNMNDVEKNMFTWLQSLPERFNLEPKNEWSKEDEEMFDAMIDIISNSLYEPLCPRDEMLAWLKKMRYTKKKEKDEAFKFGKHQLAIKFMNYLDENRPEGKMSLSNGECEDIDKAFKENDLAKILRYAEKYGKKN